MQWSATPAWSLVPGDIVSWNGVRKVGSTHWSPTPDQPIVGVVTIVFVDGLVASMSGLAPMRYIGD